MALAIDVNFTIRDAKGKTATTVVHVPSGFSLAQYAEFAAAMGQVIADISDGVITGISLSIPMDLSGATIRAVAQSAADVAKKALFIASSAVAGLFARFNLPTFDESKTIADTDQIDLADADVAAFVALIETGTTNVNARSLRNDDLVEVLSGREIFRKFN